MDVQLKKTGPWRRSDVDRDYRGAGSAQKVCSSSRPAAIYDVSGLEKGKVGHCAGTTEISDRERRT